MVSVVDIVQPPIEVPAGTAMNITESDNSIIIDESVTDTVAITTPTQSQENNTPIAISNTSSDTQAETSILFDMDEALTTTALQMQLRRYQKRATSAFWKYQ